jgi:hypothetical protein
MLVSNKNPDQMKSRTKTIDSQMKNFVSVLFTDNHLAFGE